MTKQDALKKWAEVYGKTMKASNFAGTCINTAIAYGVSDMMEPYYAQGNCYRDAQALIDKLETMLCAPNNPTDGG